MARATLVVLVLLAVAGYQPAAANEPIALKIINKSWDPESEKITFELFNTSDKIVTAWRLSKVYSAGRGPSPEVFTANDVKLCLHHPIDHPGPAPDRKELERCGLIFPGQRVASEALVVPMPSGEYPVISLKVVGVVYEDLTYEGDPAVAATFFAARAAALEQVGLHLELLRSLVSADLSLGDLQKRIWMWVQILRGESNDAAIASGMVPEAIMRLSVTRTSVAEQLEILLRAIQRQPDRAAELLDREVRRVQDNYSFRLQQVGNRDSAAAPRDSGAP